MNKMNFSDNQIKYYSLLNQYKETHNLEIAAQIVNMIVNQEILIDCEPTGPYQETSCHWFKKE